MVSTNSLYFSPAPKMAVAVTAAINNENTLAFEPPG